MAARTVLGITLLVPFDPWAYATHLGVVVLDFDQLDLTSETVRQLTRVDQDSWSAMTLKEGKAFGIVLNPAHAMTRKRSDLMHELAHIELGHVATRVEVSKTGLMLLSDYSEDQEQEADWHAAALLLPREGLMNFRMQQKAAADIAVHYGVSKQLTEWRLRMTGVDVQMRRSMLR